MSRVRPTLTYPTLAIRYGLVICQGGCGIDDDDHRTGVRRGGTIHWAARRVTAPGLAHFLALVAEASLVLPEHPAQRLWAIHTWAYRQGLKYGYRFRARYSAAAKAEAFRSLAGIDPRLYNTIYQWTRSTK